MAKLVIVDDDFACGILVENLQSLGHEVKRFDSAAAALGAVDEIAASDLLILDVIMPRPPDTGGGEVTGGLRSGMLVYQKVRQANNQLPILAYTAANDTDVKEVFAADPLTKFVSKWSTPTLSEFAGIVDTLLGIDRSPALPTPFIVHGHDEATKLAVKNYIQNTLKLPEPIVLHEQPSAGRTIIEKFEYYAAQSTLIFVLLTPDDIAAPASASNDEKRRARQNVIFELGYFIGTLGRSSGRILLLYKGALELPSDLAGVCYIDITAGIEQAGETIRRELQHVL
jgi:CheY-like chemotaxis protein